MITLPVDDEGVSDEDPQNDEVTHTDDGSNSESGA